jgi:hypothetical protein
VPPGDCHGVFQSLFQMPQSLGKEGGLHLVGRRAVLRIPEFRRL